VIEALNKPAMERFLVPELDGDAVRRIAEHVAGATHQSVNSTTPLLSAPCRTASGSGGCCRQPRQPARLLESANKSSPISVSTTISVSGVRQCEGARGARRAHGGGMARLGTGSGAAAARSNPARTARRACPRGPDHSPWLSPGNSSERTTFLNALLKEVPDTERGDFDRGHSRIAAAAAELAVVAGL